MQGGQAIATGRELPDRRAVGMHQVELEQAAGCLGGIENAIHCPFGDQTASQIFPSGPTGVKLDPSALAM